MLNTILMTAALAGTGSFADRTALQKELSAIAATSDGRVGVCALETLSAEPVCVRGSEPFPMQSVIKFIVAAVVLNEVDQKRLKLTDIIRVKPEDNSPGPQEFADLIRAKGEYPATIEELMRRSIVDSDSTSVDVLLQRLGGLAKVQDFLKQRKVEGLRIDRNERDLQSEFSGLTWQPSYAAKGKFEAAVEAASPAQKDKALEAYFKDPRDTSTPEAMVKFLKRLAAGELLSAASTQKLLAIMEQTVTGKDRLRAGLPQSWTIAHKTGTSASWRGRAATTNDVGIMTAPDGTAVAIAVFIADSKQSSSDRGAIIAKAARAVTAAFQGSRQKS